MMYPPKCPDHRFLVFELALGRLDDDDAMRAEHALESCELCKTWWTETFECADIRVVEDAVNHVFPAVELPPRRTRRSASVQSRNAYIQKWMAAAAAALVIGIGALWQSASGPRIQQVTVPAEEGIMAMDFESGYAGSQLDSVMAADTFVHQELEPAIVVARAATGSAPSGTSDEKLAGFDFESGSIAGLTPLT